MAFSASKPITLKQEQCHQTHWRNPLNQSVHIQRYTPVNQHSNWKIHLILDGCSPFLVRKDSGEFFSLLCQFTGFESTHLKPTKSKTKKVHAFFESGSVRETGDFERIFWRYLDGLHFAQAVDVTVVETRRPDFFKFIKEMKKRHDVSFPSDLVFFLSVILQEVFCQCSDSEDKVFLGKMIY